MALLAAPAVRAGDASYDKAPPRAAAPRQASGCTCAMNEDASPRRAVDPAEQGREQSRDFYRER